MNPTDAHHAAAQRPAPRHAALLLMPGYLQALVIRARLAELQQRYHGTVTAPLHLVCLRVKGTPEALRAMGEGLAPLVRDVPPVVVMSRKLEPFYSTFFQRESLKCHVDPSPPLMELSALLERAAREAGLEPQGDGPELRVTLLEEIRVERLVVAEYHQPLFTGERVVLAEIGAPARYHALHSAPLSGALPSSTAHATRDAPPDT